MLQQRLVMMKFMTGALVVALAFSTGGCLVRGTGTVGSAVVATPEPLLVELDAGVWVIEDYDDPVFYTDGFFWLYRDDGWYRSSSHTGDWVRVQAAPQVVVRLERPRQYVHYRAEPGRRVRRGPRGPINVRDRRDHRTPSRPQSREHH